MSKASEMPVEPLGPRDETIALIFIEFCCDEQGALKQHNTAFANIGVTADGEEAFTLRSVLDRVERLCACALGLGMSTRAFSFARRPTHSASKWPVNDALWSYPGMNDLLGELGLKEEAVVMLCKLGSYLAQGSLLEKD